MRIIRDDEQMLIVRDTPGFGAPICWIAIAIPLGILLSEIHDFFRYVNYRPAPLGETLVLTGVILLTAVLYFFACRTTTLEIDRLTGSVTWKQKGLFLRKRRQFNVGQLRGCWVDEMEGESGPGYRVVLKTDQGTLPLGASFTDGPEPHDSAAERIRAVAGLASA